MRRRLTADQARQILRKQCAGNQKGWASQHGVSEQYLSSVLLGKTEPGPLILRALGLRRVTLYEKNAADAQKAA